MSGSAANLLILYGVALMGIGTLIVCGLNRLFGWFKW